MPDRDAAPAAERLAELEACLIFADGETRDATQMEAHARALEIVRAAREAARGEG